MTRVTKLFHKRTFVEASGFNVKPLLPPSATQKLPAAPAAPAAATAEAAPAPKRKPPSLPDASAPADLDGLSGPKDISKPDQQQQQHLGKRKRRRFNADDRASDPAGGESAEDHAAVGSAPPAAGESTDGLTKKEREALKRRARREKLKLANTVCFLCRETGHSVKACPKTGNVAEIDSMGAAEGICYRCGSTEHRLSQCKKRADPKNPYPHASCYVCKQQGHISAHCPQNEKGLYPNGGGCRFCGSTRHLARDCRPGSRQDEVGTATLGTIDLAQGGDDDDVFLALRKIQDAKAPAGSAPGQRGGGGGRGRNDAVSAPGRSGAGSGPAPAVASAGARKQKKKVVTF